MYMVLLYNILKATYYCDKYVTMYGEMTYLSSPLAIFAHLFFANMCIMDFPQI